MATQCWHPGVDEDAGGLIALSVRPARVMERPWLKRGGGTPDMSEAGESLVNFRTAWST